MLTASQSRVLDDDLAYALIAVHFGRRDLLLDLVEGRLLLIRLRHEVECLAHGRLELHAEAAELAVWICLEAVAAGASVIVGFGLCLVAVGAGGLGVGPDDLGLGDGGVAEDLRVHPQI